MAPHSFETSFRRLDTDRSGSVDFNEFQLGLKERGLACSPAAVRELFAKADADGDGRLSMTEFKLFAMAQQERLRAVYEQIDVNGDGRLTSDEIRLGANALGFKLSSEQIRNLHERSDHDDDGVISFDEWSHFLLLLPAENPAAVFEAFGATLMVDHATGEGTPPIELATAKAGWLSVLAAKLYSGSIAGGISRTLTAPIDRLKMVMQATPPGKASGGMIAAARRIWMEGGVAAFFRGNSVNVLKIAPETSIKFLAFDSFKSAIARDPANSSISERFVAGGGAGAVAQAAVYPLEICKTRLGVSAPGTYDGLLDCLRSIVRKEGSGALFQGLSTSIAGIVPYAAIDLSVNSLLKEVVSRRGEEPTVPMVLGCGMRSSTNGTCPRLPWHSTERSMAFH